MSKQTKLATFFTISFFILSLFCAAPAQAYEIEPETQNWLLNELDFNDAIQNNDYVLVNFHALWCRYSKKLKPEWKALSEALKDYQPTINVAKVEAYDEKKLAEQYEIDGFPTIKFFIKGQPHPYNGERTKSHIQEFVDRKLKRPLSQISSKEELDAKQKEYEWIAVLAGNDIDVVRDVAFEDDMQDILFAKSEDQNVKQTATTGQLVLYNNVTKDHKIFSESMSAESLRGFLNKNRFQEVAKFSKGAAEKIFMNEDPAIILIRNKDGEAAEKEFSSAQSSLGGMFMAVANVDEDEISKLLAQNLGVPLTKLPAVVIVRADRERIRKHRLNGDVTTANIVQFYNDYKNKNKGGLAERIYLSEAEPTENKDLVKKVVGSSFEKMVMDPEKDVLLLIWAPWCGHCRAMMPVYDNVARKTREVENFLVAKIDASVNDLEAFGLDIVEYPTILFFTRKTKTDPIEFKGERNEYVFNEFIRAHAAVDLSKMKGPNPFDKNEL